MKETKKSKFQREIKYLLGIYGSTESLCVVLNKSFNTIRNWICGRTIPGAQVAKLVERLYEKKVKEVEGIE